MECTQNNREVASTIGNLVEALYDEVSALPLSDIAKGALVTIMLGDILKRSGRIIQFNYPSELAKGEAAA